MRLGFMRDQGESIEARVRESIRDRVRESIEVRVRGMERVLDRAREIEHQG